MTMAIVTTTHCGISVSRSDDSCLFSIVASGSRVRQRPNENGWVEVGVSIQEAEKHKLFIKGHSNYYSMSAMAGTAPTHLQTSQSLLHPAPVQSVQ